MDREVFALRLAASARKAWEAARRVIVEELPVPLVYRVRLNRSYDGNAPKPGEVRYPKDSATLRAIALNKCDAATVVTELWRDGHVPEWINVGVVARTDSATVVEVVCCGRYTDDDTRLYHAREGGPPFHVLGPVLPYPYDSGRFSIHLRTECWDQSDAADMSPNADLIWSFDLMTDIFDESLLAELPDMPNVDIFKHHSCTLGPGAMSAFARFPRLRMLRLHLRAPETFRIGASGAPLGSLTDLAIGNLPARAWGHGELAAIAPAVTQMRFHAAETLWLDGATGPSVREMSLTASEVSESSWLPSRLDRLSICLSQGTDQAVARLLRGVTHLRSLSLRGTPVTDAIIPVLEQYDLRNLNLVDTAATPSALNRLRADHPNIGLYPRTPPFRPTDFPVPRSSDRR